MLDNYSWRASWSRFASWHSSRFSLGAGEAGRKKLRRLPCWRRWRSIRPTMHLLLLPSIGSSTCGT